jgi:hypothetical protein
MSINTIVRRRLKIRVGSLQQNVSTISFPDNDLTNSILHKLNWGRKAPMAV